MRLSANCGSHDGRREGEHLQAGRHLDKVSKGSKGSWERNGHGNGSMSFDIKRDRERAEIFVAPGGAWGTN